MHFKAKNLTIPKHPRLLILAQNLKVLWPPKQRSIFSGTPCIMFVGTEKYLEIKFTWMPQWNRTWMTQGPVSPEQGGRGWWACGCWTGNRIIYTQHMIGNGIPPEADLIHQLLNLSGHVSNFISSWLLNKCWKKDFLTEYDVKKNLFYLLSPGWGSWGWGLVCHQIPSCRESPDEKKMWLEY